MNYWEKIEVAKQKRIQVFKDWCEKHGFKLEIDGFLDGDFTIYGIIETKRGARYYVRASTQRDQKGSTVVVKSRKSVNYCDPNSIKILINNQVLKGKLIGWYNVEE